MCEDRIFQKGKAFKGFYNSMDLLVFSKYSILELVHRKKKSTYDECHKCLLFSVIPLRLERRTCCLEGSCSIQLSYGTIRVGIA